MQKCTSVFSWAWRSGGSYLLFLFCLLENNHVTSSEFLVFNVASSLIRPSPQLKKPQRDSRAFCFDQLPFWWALPSQSSSLEPRVNLYQRDAVT